MKHTFNSLLQNTFVFLFVCSFIVCSGFVQSLKNSCFNTFTVAYVWHFVAVVIKKSVIYIRCISFVGNSKLPFIFVYKYSVVL